VDKHSRIRQHSPDRQSESTGPPSISTRVHRRLPRGEALIVVVALSLGFWRVTLEAISFAIPTPRVIRDELSPEPVHEPLPRRPEISEPPSNRQYRGVKNPILTGPQERSIQCRDPRDSFGSPTSGTCDLENVQ
jgi:hypothetical protein